jgi:branched-chain amino acid transport system ATP-binding protein
MLSVHDLTVMYGRITAVRGISFSVDGGELVSIVGPNGAGKTSTLAAIMGTVPTASGQVLLDGEPITGAAPEAIVRRGVVLVPEGRRIFGSLTVAENLAMGASVRRPGRALDEDTEHTMERFPALRPYFRSPAGRLSGGEQQMLAISRALMMGPRLMLLDEPSFGLAPLIVQEIFRIMRRINNEAKVSMLLVEQNAALALDLADHAYVLETGRVVMSGKAAQVKGDEAIRKSYLGY